MSGVATILDRWSAVALPPPPECRAARLDPKTTGFFVIDIVHHTCNATDRPGALAIVPVAACMPAEARAAVAATRYPPEGIRGFASVSRASRFGRLKDYALQAHQAIYVIIQVETPEAVANAAEIAAVDGVDCVFVGPNDLAANMGFLGNAAAPEVQQKIMEALAAIRSQGKRAGLLNYNIASAQQMFDAGFGLIAVGGDSGSIARAMDDLVTNFRSG